MDGVLLLVGLHGDEREHEGERAEDEGLDEVEHHLQAVDRDRQDGDREGGDHAEGDFATVDVAEQSHAQRDRLHELEHELDEADEDGDQAGADPVPELAEREELAQVADAERPEALELEVGEGDEGEPDRHVDVAGGRPERLDLADRRHEAAPVAEQDEDEEAGEDRDVAGRLGPAGRRGRSRRSDLVGPLDEVLEPARDAPAGAAWR